MLCSDDATFIMPLRRETVIHIYGIKISMLISRLGLSGPLQKAFNSISVP